MKFVRKISQKPLVVLDFGPETVLALVAERAAGGLRLLGGGEAPAAGVREGRVVHVGDAVEAVVEALRKAERTSGAAVETVYYNFNDPGIESTHPAGSRLLRGEGEITAADVEDAAETAERRISHFDRRIVYARPTGFVIDDKDPVPDPVGVFGRKLDVRLHVLSAPPEHCESWQRVFERALVRKSVAVPAAWSAAWGALPPEDRAGKKLVVDAGRDILNIFSFGNNMITSYRTVPVSGKDAPAAAGLAAAAARELAGSDPGFAPEAVATGSRAEDAAFLSAFCETSGMSVRAATPRGFPKLERPRYASAVGLLWVARELEGKAPLLQRDKGLLAGLKEKAVAFLNEYF